MAFIERERDQSAVRWGVLSLSFLSWVFTLLSIQKCSFLMAGEENTPSQLYHAYGLFSRPVYEKNEPGEHNLLGCIAYPPDKTFDRGFQVARGFGAILALIMTCVVLSLIMVQFFLKRHQSKILFLAVRSMLACALVSQLLIFTAYADNMCTSMTVERVNHSDEAKDNPTGLLMEIEIPSRCVPGAAGVVALFNIVIILFIITLVSLVPPPKHPIFLIQRYPVNDSDEDSTQYDYDGDHHYNHHDYTSKYPNKKKKIGLETHTYSTAEMSANQDRTFQKKGGYYYRQQRNHNSHMRYQEEDRFHDNYDIPKVINPIHGDSSWNESEGTEHLERSPTHFRNQQTRGDRRQGPKRELRDSNPGFRTSPRRSNYRDMSNKIPPQRYGHRYTPHIISPKKQHDYIDASYSIQSPVPNNDNQDSSYSMSPVSTNNDTPPTPTYVHGKETANGYSKLNDVSYRDIENEEEYATSSGGEYYSSSGNDSNGNDVYSSESSRDGSGQYIQFNPQEESTQQSSENNKPLVKVTVENFPSGKKTIKEVTHPNGSRTITTLTETIHPDGSKTVKNVVEEIDEPDVESGEADKSKTVKNVVEEIDEQDVESGEVEKNDTRQRIELEDNNYSGYGYGIDEID